MSTTIPDIQFQINDNKVIDELVEYLMADDHDPKVFQAKVRQWIKTGRRTVPRLSEVRQPVKRLSDE